MTLVRIGVEAEPEPYPEDPWLPGSRRPDRRVLVIGVVVIAGLLAVASTAWLVGTNQPQAGGAHSSHQSRPAPLGSGHAQPSQALSGHPAPSLSPASPPARSGTAPARTGQSGAGHNASGHSSTGHSSPGHTGTGPQQHRPQQHGPQQHGPRQHAASRIGPGRNAAHGIRPSGTSGSGNGQPGPGRAVPAPRSRPPGFRPAWFRPPSGSGPSRSGPPGTVRSTTPPARISRLRPSGGGKTRHAAHGIVSIGPGLARRAGVQRVAALLERYFAAVNHRQYQAYARLFAERHQLTPREFAWGYRTSHDSNATLVGVAALKGGLKATVTFTSHQDPARSPDHSSCIDWKITLFLHRAGPVYLIGMPPSGYRAGMHACRFAPRHAAQALPVPGTPALQHGVPSTGVPSTRPPRPGAPGTRDEKIVRANQVE